MINQTKKINNILKNNFIKSSYYSSSQVRGFGYSMPGYIITPEINIIYSNTKWKGKYQQKQNQTGLYCITYSNGRNKNTNELEILNKINNELKEKGIKTIFDKKGKYNIKGKYKWEDGVKIIFGNLNLLKNK